MKTINDKEKIVNKWSKDLNISDLKTKQVSYYKLTIEQLVYK